MLAWTAGPVAAQSIELGIKGGLNSSTIAWSPSALGSGPDELKRRKSFSGGLTLVVTGSNGFRLRSEVLYTGKGFAEIQDDGDITNISLNYFEIPVLLGWAFPVGDGGVVPELYAGPWLSFESSCDASLEMATDELSFDCNEVPGDPILRETTDWGWTVGAGLTFPAIGRVKGMLDVRYTAGLRNIDGEAKVDNIDARNRSYGITFGLVLPVGG